MLLFAPDMLGEASIKKTNAFSLCIPPAANAYPHAWLEICTLAFSQCTHVAKKIYIVASLKLLFCVWLKTMLFLCFFKHSLEWDDYGIFFQRISMTEFLGTIR